MFMVDSSSDVREGSKRDTISRDLAAESEIQQNSGRERIDAAGNPGRIFRRARTLLSGIHDALSDSATELNPTHSCGGDGEARKKKRGGRGRERRKVE
jgi:hypothetical protein